MVSLFAKMTLPNIVLTGPPEMAEDHQILGAGGLLGQCPKKFIFNPEYMITVGLFFSKMISLTLRC